MNGYLMQEKKWTPGEDLFVESWSPESRYGVVFEDDGEAAYFYAVQKDEEGGGMNILDALHIHEREEGDEPEATRPLLIVWSKDWLKCALVIDGFCHALFDFEAHGGYNINEFPPPNQFWTRGDRKLTDEMIKSIF
ncbi:MAG TPA: DUF2251 domain-containing protein [Puia sp.]